MRRDVSVDQVGRRRSLGIAFGGSPLLASMQVLKAAFIRATRLRPQSMP